VDWLQSSSTLFSALKLDLTKPIARDILQHPTRSNIRTVVHAGFVNLDRGTAYMATPSKREMMPLRTLPCPTQALSSWGTVFSVEPAVKQVRICWAPILNIEAALVLL